MWSTTKAFAAALTVCVTAAHDVTDGRPHHAHHHGRRGFADADEGRDASMKFMRAESHQQHDQRQHSVAAAPHVDSKDPWVVQKEIERMADRVKKLEKTGVNSDTANMADELDDVEVDLARVNQANPKLETEIMKTRETLCEERGFASHEIEECESFMMTTCGPATELKKVDLGKHRAKKRPASGECGHFFMAKRRALAGGAAPSPAAVPPGAPGPASPWAGKTILGGKGERALPEQGFEGEYVDHNKDETSIGDWQKEFGPNSGQRSFKQICRDHPFNAWCQLHGYAPTRAAGLRSGARAPAGWGFPVLAGLLSAHLLLLGGAAA